MPEHDIAPPTVPSPVLSTPLVVSSDQVPPADTLTPSLFGDRGIVGPPPLPGDNAGGGTSDGLRHSDGDSSDTSDSDTSDSLRDDGDTASTHTDLTDPDTDPGKPDGLKSDLRTLLGLDPGPKTRPAEVNPFDPSTKSGLDQLVPQAVAYHPIVFTALTPDGRSPDRNGGPAGRTGSQQSGRDDDPDAAAPRDRAVALGKKRADVPDNVVEQAETLGGEGYPESGWDQVGRDFRHVGDGVLVTAGGELRALDDELRAEPGEPATLLSAGPDGLSFISSDGSVAQVPVPVPSRQPEDRARGGLRDADLDAILLPEGHLLRRVTAGVALYRSSESYEAFAEAEFTRPVANRTTLVVGTGVTVEAVRRTVAALPEHVGRRLIVRYLDGPQITTEHATDLAARVLGEWRGPLVLPARMFAGLPDASERVIPVDAQRRPTFAEFATEYDVYPADRPPPQQPGVLGMTSGDGIWRYGVADGWVAEQTPHGVWVRPTDLPRGISTPRQASERAPAGVPRVTVGLPGTPVPDAVRSRVTALLAALPGPRPDLRVFGMSGTWQLWLTDAAVQPRAGGQVVRVPAGLYLHGGTEVPADVRQQLDALPPSRNLLRLIPDRDFASPDALSGYVAGLPDQLRGRTVVDLRLADPGRSLAAARTLAAEVGLPVLVDAGQVGTHPDPADAVPVGADGRLTFAPYATSFVVQPPGTRPARTVPGDLTPTATPGTYQLTDGWVLQVLPGGLWARPVDVPASVAADVADRLGTPGGIRLSVGAPGTVIPANVTDQLRQTLGVLPPETAARLAVDNLDPAQIFTVNRPAPAAASTGTPALDGASTRPAAAGAAPRPSATRLGPGRQLFRRDPRTGRLDLVTLVARAVPAFPGPGHRLGGPPARDADPSGGDGTRRPDEAAPGTAADPRPEPHVYFEVDPVTMQMTPVRLDPEDTVRSARAASGVDLVAGGERVVVHDGATGVWNVISVPRRDLDIATGRTAEAGRQLLRRDPSGGIALLTFTAPARLRAEADGNSYRFVGDDGSVWHDGTPEGDATVQPLGGAGARTAALVRDGQTGLWQVVPTQDSQADTAAAPVSVKAPGGMLQPLPPSPTPPPSRVSYLRFRPGSHPADLDTGGLAPSPLRVRGVDVVEVRLADGSVRTRNYTPATRAEEEGLALTEDEQSLIARNPIDPRDLTHDPLTGQLIMRETVSEGSAGGGSGNGGPPGGRRPPGGGTRDGSRRGGGQVQVQRQTVLLPERVREATPPPNRNRGDRPPAELALDELGPLTPGEQRIAADTRVPAPQRLNQIRNQRVWARQAQGELTVLQQQSLLRPGSQLGSVERQAAVDDALSAVHAEAPVSPLPLREQVEQAIVLAELGTGHRAAALRQVAVNATLTRHRLAPITLSAEQHTAADVANRARLAQLAQLRERLTADPAARLTPQEAEVVRTTLHDPALPDRLVLTAEQHREAARGEVAARTDRMADLRRQATGWSVPEPAPPTGPQPLGGVLAPTAVYSAVDAFHEFMYTQRGATPGSLPGTARVWQRLADPDSGRTADSPPPSLASARPAGRRELRPVTDDLVWQAQPADPVLTPEALARLNQHRRHVATPPADADVISVAVLAAVYHGADGLLPLLARPRAVWAETITGMLLTDRAHGGGSWPALNLPDPDADTVRQVLGWLSDGLPLDRMPAALPGRSPRQVVLGLVAHLLGRPIEFVGGDGGSTLLGPPASADLAPIVLVEDRAGTTLATVPFTAAPAVLSANGGARLVTPGLLDRSTGMLADTTAFTELDHVLRAVSGRSDPVLPAPDVLAGRLLDALTPDRQPPAGPGLAPVLRDVREALRQSPPPVDTAPRLWSEAPSSPADPAALTAEHVAALRERGLAALENHAGPESIFEALRQEDRYGDGRLAGLGSSDPQRLRSAFATLLLADLATAGTAWPLLNADPDAPAARRDLQVSWVEQLGMVGQPLPPLADIGTARIVAELFGVRVVLIRPGGVLEVAPTGADRAALPTVHLVVTVSGHTMAAVPVAEDLTGRVVRPQPANAEPSPPTWSPIPDPVARDDGTSARDDDSASGKSDDSGFKREDEDGAKREDDSASRQEDEDGSRARDEDVASKTPDHDPEAVTAPPVVAASPEVDPHTYSIGIPRSGLPLVADLVRSLRREPGLHDVTHAEWEALPQLLLSNYRYLVTDGYVVTLGRAEVKVRLALRDARRLDNPAGSYDRPAQDPSSDDLEGRHTVGQGRYHANQATNGVFQTGAHSQGQSGQGGALRLTLSAGFALGLDPAVVQVAKVGVAISGQANVTNRSTGYIKDAEVGHVEDTRADSVLFSLDARWHYDLRTDRSRPWDAGREREVEATSDEQLILAVAEHNLLQAGPQVRAGRPRDTGLTDEFTANAKRVPVTFYASSITGLPQLADGIVGRLQAGGLAMPLGGDTRKELLQKLSNVDAHFDTAVNHPDGYRFTLHDRGRVVAQVTVHAERLAEPTVRVGSTTDKAHVERVATAISGNSGGTAVRNTSGVRAGVDVDVVPLPWLSLGPSAYVGMNWHNFDSARAGRAGLWVHVSRFTGPTSAHHVKFRFHAKVAVRDRPDDAPAETARVDGSAVLRVAEADAFAHGLTVDREALPQAVRDTLPTTDGVPTVPYDPGLLRSNDAAPKDLPGSVPLPPYVLDGHGIGQGLVRIDESVATGLRDTVLAELRFTGFVPPDAARPFHVRRQGRQRNRETGLDSQLDNLELTLKMVSESGINSHYNTIHQDGLTFTLRHRDTRGRVRSARVTLHATQDLRTGENSDGAEFFVKTSSDYHTVNLAMGMDTMGFGVGGGRELVVGLKLKGGVKDAPTTQFLRGGPEYQRGISANQSVGFLSNRPELLEHPGQVDEERLPSTWRAKVEYDDGTREFVSPPVLGSATVHLLRPFNEALRPSPAPAQATDPSVLDEAVIVYLDSTGVVPLLRQMMPKLTGPGRPADEEVSNFGGTISVHAHAKEIVQGRYTTDTLFESHLFADHHGGLSIAGTLGESRYIGATPDKYVLGLIKLQLTEASQATSASHGLTMETLSWGLSGNLGDHSSNGLSNLGGDYGSNQHWGVATSRSSTRTGGKEFLDLDFHLGIAFESDVVFRLDAVTEDRGKVVEHLPGVGTRVETRHLPDRSANPDDKRKIVFVLAEPNALALYGEGKVALPDDQLRDSLGRWQKEEGEKGGLLLPSDVVARVLLRWQRDAVAAVAGTDPADRALRERLAEKLATRHNDNTRTTSVIEAHVRADFHTVFGQTLRDAAELNAFENIGVPEYLTRPGPRALGHAAVISARLDPPVKATDGSATDGGNADGGIVDRGRNDPFSLVYEAVERAAPGLLGRRPEVWTERRGNIGRLQGGLDALQGMLAGGRDHALIEDMMHTGGIEIYLVNPVGWANADVVKINLRFEITGEPQVLARLDSDGIEVYDHGYVMDGTSESRDGSRSYSLGLGFGGDKGSGGGPSLGVAEGNVRRTGRGTVGTTEQTVYDWSGHYVMQAPHLLTATVHRVDMVGRLLNRLTMRGYRRATGHDVPVTVQRSGTLRLKIPRGLAESPPIAGPSRLPDLVPMPPLPGDAYLTAVLLDDAYPVARRVLERALGPGVDSDGRRGIIALPTLLSRSHLKNHLAEALRPQGYRVADNLFLPGHSAAQAALDMHAEIFEMEIISEIVNATGTGRYAKHQTGTTASTSGNQWAPSIAGGFGQDNVLSNPANLNNPWGTLSEGTGAARLAPRNQAAAGTGNYRREQHLKQQGPVYLVRLRVKAEFTAHRFHQHMVGPPTATGTFHSDPVTGDVYAEMLVDEVREWQRRLEQRKATAERSPDPATWAAVPAASPRENLDRHLVDAARTGTTARQAGGDVVSALRDRLGADAPRPRWTMRPTPDNARDTRPVVLTTSEAVRAHDTYRAVLGWAQQHSLGDRMLERLNQARAAAEPLRGDPTRQPELARLNEEIADLESDLREFRSWSEQPPAPNPITAGRKAVDVWTRRTTHLVNWVNSRPEPGGAPLGPHQLPPEVSVLALDPVHTGRQIAHELGRHVLLEHTAADGAITRHRIDPSGRTYHATADGRPEPLADAVARLPRELRDDLVLLDDGVLQDLYRDSWTAQQTFEQAVRQRVAEEGRISELRRLADRVLRGRSAAEVQQLLDEAASIMRYWTLGITYRRIADYHRHVDDNLPLVEQVVAALGGTGPLLEVASALAVNRAAAVYRARQIGDSRYPARFNEPATAAEHAAPVDGPPSQSVPPPAPAEGHATRGTPATTTAPPILPRVPVISWNFDGLTTWSASDTSTGDGSTRSQHATARGVLTDSASAPPADGDGARTVPPRHAAVLSPPPAGAIVETRLVFPTALDDAATDPDAAPTASATVEDTSRSASPLIPTILLNMPSSTVSDVGHGGDQSALPDGAHAQGDPAENASSLPDGVYGQLTDAGTPDATLHTWHVPDRPSVRALFSAQGDPVVPPDLAAQVKALEPIEGTSIVLSAPATPAVGLITAAVRAAAGDGGPAPRVVVIAVDRADGELSDQFAELSENLRDTVFVLAGSWSVRGGVLHTAPQPRAAAWAYDAGEARQVGYRLGSVELARQRITAVSGRLDDLADMISGLAQDTPQPTSLAGELADLRVAAAAARRIPSAASAGDLEARADRLAARVVEAARDVTPDASPAYVGAAAVQHEFRPGYQRLTEPDAPGRAVYGWRSPEHPSVLVLVPGEGGPSGVPELAERAAAVVAPPGTVVLLAGPDVTADQVAVAAARAAAPVGGPPPRVVAVASAGPGVVGRLREVSRRYRDQIFVVAAGGWSVAADGVVQAGVGGSGWTAYRAGVVVPGGPQRGLVPGAVARLRVAVVEQVLSDLDGLARQLVAADHLVAGQSLKFDVDDARRNLEAAARGDDRALARIEDAVAALVEGAETKGLHWFLGGARMAAAQAQAGVVLHRLAGSVSGREHDSVVEEVDGLLAELSTAPLRQRAEIGRRLEERISSLSEITAALTRDVDTDADVANLLTVPSSRPDATGGVGRLRLLAGALGPYRGEPDCVVRLGRLADGLYGPVRAVDDTVLGVVRAEDGLVVRFGGRWTAVSSVGVVVEAVRAAGRGASGFVTAAAPGVQGHGFLLHHDSDGLLWWVETQAGQDARVRSVDEGSPYPGVGVRALVVDGGGRFVDVEAGTDRVGALLDPPARRANGMSGLQPDDGMNIDAAPDHLQGFVSANRGRQTRHRRMAAEVEFVPATTFESQRSQAEPMPGESSASATEDQASKDLTGHGSPLLRRFRVDLPSTGLGSRPPSLPEIDVRQLAERVEHTRRSIFSESTDGTGSALRPVSAPPSHASAQPSTAAASIDEPAAGSSSMDVSVDDASVDGGPAPWYIGRGASGAFRVQSAGWEREAALAQEIAVALPVLPAELPRGTDAEEATLRQGVQDRLAALLRVERAAVDAPPDAAAEPTTPDDIDASTIAERALGEENTEKWDDLLREGWIGVIADRVVWIRPRLHALRAMAGDASSGLRLDLPGTSTTSSISSRRQAVPRGIAGTLGTVATMAASFLSPPLMRPTTSSTEHRSTVESYAIISGRSVHAGIGARFASGVAFEISVDGVPWGEPVPVPAERGLLIVDLPEQGTSQDVRLRDTPLVEPADGTRRGAAVARATLTAITFADVQRHLIGRLREGGLPAASTAEIVRQVASQRLNERTASERSRWLLSGADSTGLLVVPVEGGRQFQGNVAIQLTLREMQRLGETPSGTVQDDLGVVRGASAGWDTSSDFTVSGTAGINADGAGGIIEGGFGPQVKKKWGRSTAQDLSIEGMNRTLLSRMTPQVRYRAAVTVQVSVASSTHRLGPVIASAEAEIRVPATDADAFERAHLGASIGTGAVPVQFRPLITPILEDVPAPLTADQVAQRLGPPRPDAPQVRAPYRSVGSPRPDEPLILAARRGDGPGTTNSLPGASRVAPLVLAALRTKVDSATAPHPAEWGGVQRGVYLHYGTPALEGNPGRLRTGVFAAFEIGGKRYSVLVVGHPRQWLDSRSYQMTISNETMRAAGSGVGVTVTQSASAGLAADFALTGSDAIALPFRALQADVTLETSTERSPSRVARSYRRATTSGMAWEHTYEMVYEVVVRPDGGERSTWLIDGPDVQQQVVVADEHLPRQPITAAEAAAVQTRIYLPGTSPPPLTAPRVPLDTFGVSGVFPRFADLPELSALVARLYGMLHNRPGDWHREPMNWPETVWKLGVSTELDANLAALTRRDSSWSVSLGDVDGWESAVEISAVVSAPAHLWHSERIVLEQYSQLDAHFDVIRRAELVRSAGTSSTVAAQIESSVPNSSTLGFSDDVSRDRATAEAVRSGSNSITGATYGGVVRAYRAGRVRFAVRLVRWNASTSADLRATLDLEHGLELLVPDRIATDLDLPNATAAIQPDGPRRVEVDQVLGSAAGRFERLRADGLLEQIRATLVERDLIPRHDERPNELWRAIFRAFSSDALELRAPADLFGSGVHGWFLAPGALNGVGFVFVRIVGKLGAPESDLSRPETSLTVHDEAIDSVQESESSGRSAEGWRFGSAWDSVDGAGRGQRSSIRSVFQYGTSGSYEQNIPVTFTVEIGYSNQLPEVLQTIGAAARSVVAGVAGWFGADQRVRTVLDHQPFAWRDERVVGGGSVRRLLPVHLTRPAGIERFDRWKLLARLPGSDPRPMDAPPPPASSDGKAPPGGPNLNALVANDRTFVPVGLPTAREIGTGLLTALNTPASGLEATNRGADAAAVPQLLQGSDPQSRLARFLHRHLISDTGFALGDDLVDPAQFIDERHLRPRLAQLLAHRYELPGTGIRLGVVLTEMSQLLDADEQPLRAELDGRGYGQRTTIPADRQAGLSRMFAPERDLGRGLDGTVPRRPEDRAEYTYYRYGMTVVAYLPNGQVVNVAHPQGLYGISRRSPDELLSASDSR
ncbi:hypothetical protein ACIBTV_30715 [Micromonospora sp. NPDC049366]|uniref:hypothetical protein n=1 Tax=Micromonospora sp. NPDC049366 TaxID=3364271 RepID=UPI00378A606C